MRYFLAVLLLIAVPAMAAPKDDLHAAYVKFLAYKSFRVDIDSTHGKQKAKSVVEFQAPDRYRISNDKQAPNLVIGGTMYMNISGKMMKILMPGLKDMLAQYRNADMLKELEVGVTVESLGNELLGKQMTKKYRYKTTKPHVSDNTMWIANDGNILQIETTGVMGKAPFRSVLRYSQYNSPAIKILAP